MPGHTDSNIVRGVIGVIRRGERFLLIRRAAHLRAGGVWCFPGGHIEPGESEADALIREMNEELGARIRPLRRFHVLRKHAGRLVLACWSARLTRGRLRPNPDEVADLRWMTPGQLHGMPRTRAITACPIDGPDRLIAGSLTIVRRLNMAAD